jgi:hypothetical protein
LIVPACRWRQVHVFANIRSPTTVANLRRNASIEINVVDAIVRKGYRFKGVATLIANRRVTPGTSMPPNNRFNPSVRLVETLVSSAIATGLDRPY